MPPRLLILFGSILLTCAATLAPVIISIRIANIDDARNEQARLQAFANRVMAHTESITNEAISGLARVLPDEHTPCSPENIEQLRRRVFNYYFIRDAGFYSGKQYLCSALMGDVQDQNLTMPAPGRLTRDGYSIWFSQMNPLSDLRSDIQIGRNGRYVSIDPQSYVDLIDPAQRPIAVIDADQNVVLAVSPGTSGAEMIKAWKTGGHIEGSRWRYAVARSAKRPALAVVVKTLRDLPSSSAITSLITWVGGGLAIACLVGYLGYRRVSRQLSFPATLQWAISHRGIEVHYQPVIGLGDGRCAGVEAVARWQLRGRAVAPEVFIAVAEQNQLIQGLTDLVLDKAIEGALRELRADPSFYLSVNVSASDLQDGRLPQAIAKRLAGTGVKPGQICIEIDEHHLSNAPDVRNAINALREAGYPVYIDNFGTTYAGLAYLQSFTVDALKLDRSFVAAIGNEATPSVVVTHTIAMAHELGLKIIADGIENQNQFDYLREQRVQYGQGWFFCEPLASNEFLDWIRRRNEQNANANSAGGAHA
ncbi:EAL domain-containing protein [Paraburkholderia heleia]|uniref:EAL domain-containing protein n=1 Tax=Paraburkholderia heleia TaxID=634127 RepID=UPI0031CF3274